MTRREARIVVLGTSVATANATLDNTYLVFDSYPSSFLIDCAGSPAHKLLKAGIEPERLEGVILTHAHADHIYGLPVFVQHLHLMGRDEPLYIYANVETQRVALTLLNAFDMVKEFAVLRRIPEEEGHLLIENDDYTIHTSPMCHSLPSVAVKISGRRSGRTLVYSGDTAPCRELLALARGADVLIHECSVEEPFAGHSTVRQAAEVAAQCGVGRLVLIHYPPSVAERPREALAEASKHYGGEVHIAQEYDVYCL